ncbi:leucine-rich repeat domain-containing protein [Poseidonibacter antarcticus]|uniref:leucine-rich repeat domain-containing protein n=1 Tax=Poseidonibacter antarcticus TaxID=2478538 RepID=UPI000EF497FD|nr:leucine-rich repeat domain-containing protein [Poseidonibacter antarcticus]
MVFYTQEDEFFGDDSKITKIALNIFDIYHIYPNTTKNIFSNLTMHLDDIGFIIPDEVDKKVDLDIFELLDFSKKRQEIISHNIDDKKNYLDVKIEDEYGSYVATYFNGIVINIKTTYIFHLPNELCDTFEYTNKKILSHVQTNNYEVNLIVNEDDLEDIYGISFKKNIDKIEQIEKLIKWADKYNIEQMIFPKEKGFVRQCNVFENFEDFELEEIPKELFEIKKNSFSFNFINNKIKLLPEDIGISKCNTLILCNNKIEEFPKSVYELKELELLCLHSNKLKSLPEDIDRLTKLKTLSISNNAIKEFPISISNMKSLKEIDIENTLINEKSLEYLHLENLEKICFDDKLLPWFIKNFHKLININTINIIHSKYNELDEEIINLGLEFDNESWMKEKDYLGNGCILL